jgi:serine O-acetyltransferase
MNLSIEPSREKFEEFLSRQFEFVALPLGDVRAEVDATYPLLAKQFARIRNKYFRGEEGPVLRLGHSAQYMMFLYALSRRLAEAGRRLEADKIYLLLRTVSGADIYYEVGLPLLWFSDHPLGSVIGRGTFAPESSLVFSQNSNIGNNGGVYPEISGNLYMYGNTTLLGGTHIAGNVVLSNGACVIDAGELRDCFVFGRSPDLIIKPLSQERFDEINAFRAG